MIDDAYGALRKQLAAGSRIQANRGSREEPHWVTLDGMPEFTCDADLYRVHPDDIDQDTTA